MGDPVTSIILSSLNFLIKAAELGTQFHEVSSEVRQLQSNIVVADDAINTATRLLRTKWTFLEAHLKSDSEKSVANTETVLKQIRDCVEDCRKDLELNQRVSVKNRIFWLLWKNKAFLAKLSTLGTCLGALNRDIVRMEAVVPPTLSTYRQTVTDDEVGGGAGGRWPGTRKSSSFPRSPTLRRKARDSVLEENVVKIGSGDDFAAAAVIERELRWDDDYDNDNDGASLRTVSTIGTTISEMDEDGGSLACIGSGSSTTTLADIDGDTTGSLMTGYSMPGGYGGNRLLQPVPSNTSRRRRRRSDFI